MSLSPFLRTLHKRNLVKNMAQKTASRNSSKRGTYRSLTKHGEFYGFSDLWQQIWLTNVRWRHRKLITFKELYHAWLKTGLINQSIGRVTQGRALAPRIRDFYHASCMFPTTILKMSPVAKKLKDITRNVRVSFRAAERRKSTDLRPEVFLSDIRS